MRQVAIFLFLSLPCLATTIHVPADQPTIQAGIDAASAGDTVLVACGTYTWVGEGSGVDSVLIRMKSNITLRSETGIENCTTIDAQQQGRVFECVDLNSSTSIEGFTILGGFSTTFGGGMSCENAFLSILNCLFVENVAVDLGGGLYCDASSPTLRNCTFERNSVLLFWGGGLYCFESSPEMIYCNIIGNTAGSDGGGVFFRVNSSPYLESCFFEANEAVRNGGALYSNYGSPQLLNCTFYENSATDGGAIHCFYSNAEISSCTFTGNIASNLGGGLFCRGASLTSVSNCILWGDTFAEIFLQPEADITVTCSVVEGGWPGTGIIDENPLFCAPNVSDFHLQGDSPCAPDNNDCGVLIGAWPVGCSTNAEDMTWSEVKALY
jgi:predicted outer membrane repeat protein